MDFILFTLGMVAFIVVILVLLARAYPGSGADLVDWKPTRSYETEALLEEEDIEQMMAAQNAYRRKRGDADLTQADLARMAEEDEEVRNRGRRFSEEIQKEEADLEDLGT